MLIKFPLLTGLVDLKNNKSFSKKINHFQFEYSLMLPFLQQVNHSKNTVIQSNITKNSDKAFIFSSYDTFISRQF